MKIRTSFVSNSSSSSFIIYIGDLDPNVKTGLELFLEAAEKDPDRYSHGSETWGDSERTYNIDGNFINIETWVLSDNFWNEFQQFGIPKDHCYEDY